MVLCGLVCEAVVSVVCDCPCGLMSGSVLCCVTDTDSNIACDGSV